MIDLALYQPEIPQNTGNLIRLCANARVCLHLIPPLGFVWDDRRLRRAGLDYHDLAAVTHHPSAEAFFAAMEDRRIWALSTRGSSRYDQVRYRAGDVLLAGPETRGLPPSLLSRWPEKRVLRIPMAPGSRSLNLANACAVALYEGLRQLDFPDLDPASL